MILTELTLPPLIEMDSNTGKIMIVITTVILGDGVELTRLRKCNYFNQDQISEAKECFGDSMPEVHKMLDAVADLPITQEDVIS
jgi:hypothetical protein